MRQELLRWSISSPTQLADLPMEIVQELGITVVPLNVQIGEESFRDRIDLSDARPDRAAPAWTRAAEDVAAGGRVFEETFRSLLPSRSARFISPPSCPVHGSARLAADVLGTQSVALIDSRTVTMGLGWLVVIAARVARDGRSLDDCVAAVRDRISRQPRCSVLDTLELVHRGGRIRTVAAMLGSLLSVKPIISVDDGAVTPVAETGRHTPQSITSARCSAIWRPGRRSCVLHADNLTRPHRLS